MVEFGSKHIIFSRLHCCMSHLTSNILETPLYKCSGSGRLDSFGIMADPALDVLWQIQPSMCYDGFSHCVLLLAVPIIAQDFSTSFRLGVCKS